MLKVLTNILVLLAVAAVAFWSVPAHGGGCSAGCNYYYNSQAINGFDYVYCGGWGSGCEECVFSSCSVCVEDERSIWCIQKDQKN